MTISARQALSDTVESAMAGGLVNGAEINGGFFVLSPKILDHIEGDHTVWNCEPMERLA